MENDKNNKPDYFITIAMCIAIWGNRKFTSSLKQNSKDVMYINCNTHTHTYTHYDRHAQSPRPTHTVEHTDTVTHPSHSVRTMICMAGYMPSI